jgi:hypothetical protein
MYPTVGHLVRETVLLRRSYDCDHKWVALPAADPPTQFPEEQCSCCSFIVGGNVPVEQAKLTLKRMSNNFHGRRML